MIIEEVQDRRRRAQPLELGEDGPDGSLHLLIGIKLDLPFPAIDITGRESNRQLSPPGLTHPGAVQALLDGMQLHLAEGALQAQEQPVVEQARIVDGGVISDQGPAHGTQLEEPIPLGRVPGEADHLEGQDEAHLAQADRRGEIAKAIPPMSGGTSCPALALILVDDPDLLRCPAELLGTFRQPVLPAGALWMLTDLVGMGLPHIDQGLLAQMPAVDLGVRHHPHRRPVLRADR
jgi:hypothetical protein